MGTTLLNETQCAWVGGAGIVFYLAVWRIVLRDAVVVGFNQRATLSNYIVVVIIYAACNLAFYTQLLITRELNSRAFFAVHMIGSNVFFASLWVIFSGCIKQTGGSSVSRSWTGLNLRDKIGCLWEGNHTTMTLISYGTVVLLIFNCGAIVWMFVRCDELSTFYLGDVYLCSNLASALLGGVFFVGMRRVAGQMLAIRNFSQQVVDVTGVTRLAIIASRIWIACSISSVCLGLHCLGLVVLCLQMDAGMVTALWLTLGQFIFSGVPTLAFLLIVTPEMANRESQGYASPAFRNGAAVSIASSCAGDAHAAAVAATANAERDGSRSSYSINSSYASSSGGAEPPPASASQTFREPLAGSAAEEGELPYRFQFRWKKFLSFVGPGFLMSLAYLDPGNIEADLELGSYTSYNCVWVLWWSTLIGLMLQEMSARLGVVTGKSLSVVCSENYSQFQSRLLYIMIEIAIIGSDTQEVLGSAIAIHILSGGAISLVTGCIMTGVDTFTFLALHYYGVRYLEAMVIVLILTITVCFSITWDEAVPDQNSAALMYGWVVPMLRRYAVLPAAGTLGAVVMPHNLYLHSGLVLSRKVDRTSHKAKADAVRYNLMESTCALMVSFVINLSMVAVFSHLFFANSCAHVSQACLPDGVFKQQGGGRGETCGKDDLGEHYCGSIGLLTAAVALRDAVGPHAKYVWAIGLLCAGQASTITATFAGQIVMEGFLSLKMSPCARIAVTRAAALGPAVILAFSTSQKPSLLNNINGWLNILQSVQLPFAFLPLLRMIGDPKLVGRFANSNMQHAFCWLLAIFVLALNIFIVIDFVLTTAPTHGAAVFKLGSIFFLAGYAAIVTEVVRDDLAVAWTWIQKRVVEQGEQYEPTPSTSGSYADLGGGDESEENGVEGAGAGGMVEPPTENDPPRHDGSSPPRPPMIPPRGVSV
jgi:natural resistance-associated macrophage protein